jgi:prevent-host-death family protein
MQATAKDLRFHVSTLLKTVERGEEVIITYRGRPCAKLVPLDPGNQVDEQTADKLFGIWKDRAETEDVDGYLSKLRKERFHAD